MKYMKDYHGIPSLLCLQTFQLDQLTNNKLSALFWLQVGLYMNIHTLSLSPPTPLYICKLYILIIIFFNTTHIPVVCGELYVCKYLCFESKKGAEM